jgi:hypothetical protein
MKGNGAIEESGSTQAQLNRLKSTVNCLTKLLGPQGLMGQLGFIYPINSFKAQSEYRSPNKKLGSSNPEPTNNLISPVKIKAQHVNNSPTGKLCLEDRLELPNVLNKCLAVGFAPKIAPMNCTKWILDSGATDHMTGN